MSAEKQRAAEDLLADLNDLPDDPNALAGDAGDTDEASINEFLAEFSRDRERPSRPITPRLPGSKARASPRLGLTADSRAHRSGEASRLSTESKRSNKDDTTTFTNSSVANSDKSEKGEETETGISGRQEAQEHTEAANTQKKVYGSGASWSSWGGSLWSTANSLQTQLRAEAEKRLAELQASEEAQKIQARLRELDLSKLASEARNIGQGVLDAVAPPIEDNETLVVNVIHDIVGVKIEIPVYTSFQRVMEQVEGGSLHVMAKDREGTLDLHSVPESVQDARKMNIAAIEDKIREIKGEPAERTSSIFLSIQACTLVNLIPGKETAADQGEDEGELTIVMNLHDPSNDISYCAVSQSFPASWIPLSLQSVEAAVQPREWISEWIEEAVQLNAGILAQRYVARRMGIDKPVTSKAPSIKDGKEAGLKAREGQDLSEAGLGL